MANYGIKISKEGKDVKVASLGELILTSENNLFKIKQEGEVTFNYSANESGVKTNTIYHNLGYFPSFRVHGKVENYSEHREWANISGVEVHIGGYVYTDRLVISCYKEVGMEDSYSTSYKAYYMIFYDSLPT